MNQQSTARYDFLSRTLHWLTAVVVTAAFTLGPDGFGRLMRRGVDPATRSDIVWHETLGTLVLVLTALRLVWVTLRPPAPRFSMARWMHVTAKLMHLALWALLLALPATAFLALGSEAHPLTLLGSVRVDQMPIIADSALAKLSDWGGSTQDPGRRHHVACRPTCGRRHLPSLCLQRWRSVGHVAP